MFMTKKDGAFVLKFEYVCDVSGSTYTFSATNTNEAKLRAMGKNIITQLRSLDSQLINTAFEDAFLKD